VVVACLLFWVYSQANMLFWGYGTKTKYWDVGNGYFVVCVFRYAHFMFVIRSITSKKWYVQGERRSEDRELTDAEIDQFYEEYDPKISAYVDTW